MKTSRLNLRSLLTDTPPPLGGLALAIASLGWCWDTVLGQDLLIKHVSALVATFLLVPLFLKYSLDNNKLLKDLADPVVGSVMPTATMAVMIISNSVGDMNRWIGDGIWLAAILTHFLLMIGFVYFRFKQFSLNEMLPSWFIPPIGIVAADVSFSGAEAIKPLAEWIFIFGLFAYAVMLPAMLYRLIFLERVPATLAPTIAVLAAPASLTLAGYLTITEQAHSVTLIALLFGVALAMTSTLYVSLLYLLKLPFSPALSATTFPLVIGATALYKLTDYIAEASFDEKYISQLQLIANIELIIATSIVAYVTLRFVTVFWTESQKYFVVNPL
jgi:tellurite resistance protein TehA-like permease